MAHIEDSFYQDIIIPSFRDTYPYIEVTDQVIIQAIREVEQCTDENTPLEIVLDRMQDYRVSKEKLTKILEAYFLNILKTEYLSKQTHIVHIDNILDETSISNLIDYSEDSSNGYIIQDITNPENPIIYTSYLYQVDEEGDTIQPNDNI